jgi:hypothetical protein
MTERKEVRHVHGLFQLNAARDLHVEDRRHTRSAAHAREAQAIRAASSSPARRALGRSLIKLGERIAAEPALRPVRSR